MSQRSTSPGPIAYRSVRERTFEDQAETIKRGYNSVLELALDELNEALVLLQARMDKLEGQQGHRAAKRQMYEPEA